jgi:diguanylate cyclase (GGDEF)-like protein
MNHSKSKSLILFYGLFFLAYVYGIVIHSDIIGNLLSPTGALIAGISLFVVYHKTIVYKTLWFLLAMACISWFIGDVIWSYSEMVLNLSPESLPALMLIFNLPNLFIALGIGYLFYKLQSNWEKSQFILDFLFTLLSFLLVFWSLFMQDQTFALYKMDTVTLALFFNILTDFFALLLIFVLYLSTTYKSRSTSLKLLIISITLYTLSDLYYCYLTFNNAYVPNSALDATYMASLLVLGYAGIQSLDNPLPDATLLFNKTPNPFKNRKGMFWLLLLPIILLTVKGLLLNETITLILLFLIHQLLTSYTSKLIQKELHIEEIRGLNAALESRVDERTKALQELNIEYSNLSKLDSITFLLNRRTFLDHLDFDIENLIEHQRLVLYVFDLSRFKTINSTYGHDKGDQVLKAVADRLKTLGQSRFILARLGGDEFGLYEKGFINRFEIEETASNICTLFVDPLIVESTNFHLAVSVGISCLPTDASDRSSLLRNADMAMFHSKNQGYNKFTVFSAMSTSPIKRKHTLENLLKKALINNEFHLVYQPQFELSTQKLIGMEALLRWISPEIGNVPPSEFIPIAEETGLIVSIGQWVIDQSLVQIHHWNTIKRSQYKMGINISPTQLNTVSFITHLEKQLLSRSIPAQWIDIEITETSTMDSDISMEEILTALSAIGISISIDDFGTGYSSLSYIKAFDIDRLKIAKPLIDGIVERYNDHQIVQAIIHMSLALDIQVIAEGVESQEQADLLTAMGCHQIQGYLMGRPTSAEQFEKLYLK